MDGCQEDMDHRVLVDRIKVEGWQRPPSEHRLNNSKETVDSVIVIALAVTADSVIVIALAVSQRTGTGSGEVEADHFRLTQPGTKCNFSEPKKGPGGARRKLIVNRVYGAV